jgi:4-amino-4-deoxy-L-arabinose transferase-like glycosyltransferase
MQSSTEPTLTVSKARRAVVPGAVDSLRSLAASHSARLVATSIAVFWFLNAVFMFRDHSQPAWDQSYYMANAWTMVLAHHQGLSQMWHAIMNTDPSHGPLLEVSIAFWMGLFGPHVNSAMCVNLVSVVILTGSVAGISQRIGGRRAVPWAVALTLTMPLMVGLSRNVLEDFTLTSLSAFSLLAAIRCRRFASLPWSIALAIGFAAAMLTKVTAPVEIALGLLAGLALGTEPIARLTPTRHQFRNFGVAVILGALLLGWWYIPNWSQTIAYVKSTTGGPLALGAGPTNPITWPNLKTYFGDLVNFHLGWGVVFVALLGTVCGGKRVWIACCNASGLTQRDRLLRFAFPLLWLFPAVLLQAASINQDQRLVGPALVGGCVLAASAIALIRWRAVLVLAGLSVAAFAAWPLAMHTFGPDEATQPVNGSIHAATPGSDVPTYTVADLIIDTPLGPFVGVFGNDGVGYEVAPLAVNHSVPVVRWILAERRRRGITGAITLGVLDTNSELNGNVIHWLDVSTGSGQRIVVEQPATTGLTHAQIQAEFDSYTAVITFSSSATPSSGRSGLLNEQLVTSGRAARYLRAFTGPHATFPLVTGSAEVRWRSTKK